MASENEGVVRRALEAWNVRDAAALTGLTHPEVVYVNAPEAVEPGTRRGRDEVAVVLEKQWEILGDTHQEVVRLHDRGEVVITETRVSRHMPGTSDLIENRVLMSWTIRDGLIERIEVLGGGSAFEDARRRAGLG